MNRPRGKRGREAIGAVEVRAEMVRPGAIKSVDCH